MLPWPALPIVTLPGLAFSQAISSFRLFAGTCLVCSDHERRDDQQRHRLEIGQQVVRQVVVGRAGDDMRAVLAEADGVAVGRGAHGPADADGASRAGDVLDDDGLAERHPHPLGEDASDHVGRSAGRERHDDGDRLRRIGLREGKPRHRRQRDRARGQMQKAAARKLHCDPFGNALPWRRPAKSDAWINLLQDCISPFATVNPFATASPATPRSPPAGLPRGCALSPRRSAGSICAESVTFSP